VPLRSAFTKKNSHPIGRLFFLVKARLGRCSISIRAIGFGFLCCFQGLPGASTSSATGKPLSPAKKPLAATPSFPFGPSRRPWFGRFLFSSPSPWLKPCANNAGMPTALACVALVETGHALSLRHALPLWFVIKNAQNTPKHAKIAQCRRHVSVVSLWLQP
jgi:hypothetical protein